VFEFRTEANLTDKKDRPHVITSVHRYVLQKHDAGAKVDFTSTLQRYTEAPWYARVGLFRPVAIRISASLMGRGFRNLLAMADERAHAHDGTDTPQQG